MSHGPHYRLVLQLARRAAGALQVDDQMLSREDTDGLRYVATIAVRVHWFLLQY